MDFLLNLFIFSFPIFLVVVLLVFITKIWGYLYPFLFWGAVDVPTPEAKVVKIVKLLGAKPDQAVVDLGAGEGRLLIALAKTGVKAYGYEINPLLVLRAKKKIKQAGLEGRAFIYWKSMWNVGLNDFDAVVIYPMGHIMKKLEEKFDKELRPGTKVVSNYFTLPTWKPDKAEDKIYLYIKK